MTRQIWDYTRENYHNKTATNRIRNLPLTTLHVRDILLPELARLELLLGIENREKMPSLSFLHFRLEGLQRPAFEGLRAKGRKLLLRFHRCLPLLKLLVLFFRHTGRHVANYIVVFVLIIIRCIVCKTQKGENEDETTLLLDGIIFVLQLNLIMLACLPFNEVATLCLALGMKEEATVKVAARKNKTFMVFSFYSKGEGNNMRTTAELSY